MADNTNAFSQLPEDLVGYDLLWEDDFHADATAENHADVLFDDGDFVVEAGPEMIRRALLRRIITPQGAYGLIVQDVDGVHVLDSEYGNPVGSVLSEPMNTEWLSRVSTSLGATVNQDPRVTLLNVQADFTPSGQVTFSIQYRINTLSEMTDQVQSLMVGLSKDGQKFTGV